MEQPTAATLKRYCEAAAVIGAVSAWEPSDSEGAELKRKTVNYLQGQAPRMQYQSYQEQGFHLGSGVAEAACKQVVQARLKGAVREKCLPANLICG